MPTIEISKKDLESLSGKKFKGNEELSDALLYVKGELEGALFEQSSNGRTLQKQSSAEGDTLKVDIKETNRPDLWSVEGIARELRAKIGKERGIPKYSAKPSGITATVDPKLAGIRPKAAYAVAKNVKVTDDFIKQTVQLQEKVCQTFGRKRDEVAIGVFDFDKVHGNVRYIAAPWDYEFVPLGYTLFEQSSNGRTLQKQSSGVKMSLCGILKAHPKGIEYGKLIAGKKFAPLLVDGKNEVLSMPPIINSEGSGKITAKTRNLFIDVTGHRQENVDVALRVMCMAFADRGAKIESVNVKYADKTITTPSFGTEKIEFDSGLVEEYSGLGLKEKEVIALLEKSRMNAKFKGKKLLVEYGNYRSDILHPVDVIEDIIMAYGYNRIKPEKVKVSTTGKELPQCAVEDALREIGVGLGLQEVLTYVLTSRDTQEAKIGLKDENLAEIANPVSENLAVMRKRIFPELLALFAKNKHRAYPQRIFEIGSIVEPALFEQGSNGRTLQKQSSAAGESTGAREPLHICIALCGAGSSFTQIKSVLDSVARHIGAKYELRETASLQFFAQGRCAEITVGKKKGVLGEVSKKVLENFGLEQDACVLELEF